MLFHFIFLQKLGDENIGRYMSNTIIKRTQLIKTDIDSLWTFMSSPKNLAKITPKYMLFKITSNNANEAIYPGMIISYKISPLLKLQMNWVTEITNVKEKTLFIDEQRKGPYKIWHHEHKFKKTNNGILMIDTISYKPPFGMLGELCNYLFIKKRVNQIFDYRHIMLEKIFHS